MKAMVPTMAFLFTQRKRLWFLPALILMLSGACNQSDLKEPLIYDGPLQVLENVELYYTEDNVVKVKMIAAMVYEFENGDREFPKGIYLEFYDENGQLESTLRANEAYFFKKENQWRGRGKVEVKNLEKKVGNTSYG